MGRIDLIKIRRLVQNGSYLIKTHARKRIAERGIRENEVIQVILRGTIVEETPDAKPFPKCLIWYDPDKWLDPWRRRR